MITIREQTEADKDQIWEIIHPVILKGDTYYFAPDSSKEKMLEYWFDKKKKGYVAVHSVPSASRDGAPKSLPSAPADGLSANSNTSTSGESRVKETIIGIFFITQNFPDLASHIANAAYMVSPDARGIGVGRLMAEFSLNEAKRLGFKAMQFNFVIKTNEPAIKLWKDLGFNVIGEIPEAFRHQEKGPINAVIMFRTL